MLKQTKTKRKTKRKRKVFSLHQAMHYYDGKADRSEDIFDFEPTADEDDQQSPQDAVQPLKKKSKKARRRPAVGQQPGQFKVCGKCCTTSVGRKTLR